MLLEEKIQKIKEMVSQEPYVRGSESVISKVLLNIFINSENFSDELISIISKDLEIRKFLLGDGTVEGCIVQMYHKFREVSCGAITLRHIFLSIGNYNRIVKELNLPVGTEKPNIKIMKGVSIRLDTRLNNQKVGIIGIGKNKFNVFSNHDLVMGGYVI